MRAQLLGANRPEPERDRRAWHRIRQKAAQWRAQARTRISGMRDGGQSLEAKRPALPGPELFSVFGVKLQATKLFQGFLADLVSLSWARLGAVARLAGAMHVL